MLNLTYLEADYRICTDEKFNFNGMHFNFTPKHDYEIKRYTDHWGMSLQQMREAIEAERSRRDSLFACFETEIDNSILKQARLTAKYLNRGNLFGIGMETPLNWTWNRNTKERISLDTFTEEFSKRFKGNWSYSYLDTEISLNELMAYVTFRSENGYSFGSRDFICGVAEYPITPKLIRTINAKLTEMSRYKAENDYKALQKAERERQIEAFRLKQIYGE